jgi:GrpB-like predicted nucleotidyltransferase (UPF0157 family)
VVTVDDSQWRNYLKFRDVLRAAGVLRARYDELRRALQEQFAEDRAAYTSAKDDFIRGVLSAS